MGWRSRTGSVDLKGPAGIAEAQTNQVSSASSSVANTAIGITGSLGLLLLPFTFTQDRLLRSDAFIKLAQERGHDLNRSTLERLHGAGLLVPFYRVSDTAITGRQLPVRPDGNLDTHRDALQAAAAGRLRDCADEGYSTAWPYSRPADETDPRWWDGFLFSSWQVIDVHQAGKDERWLALGDPSAERQNRARRRRMRATALAALAPRYLPGIVGHLPVPPGVDTGALRGLEFETNPSALLAVADVQQDDLWPMAEDLLLDAAFRDPLRDWLPIIRHANYDAWSKLKGVALDCLWQRIAAEVLLRAHDDLAAEGIVEPLPDIRTHQVRHPLHDRLSRQATNAESLDESLGRFGLSPYPRVLLVVEGETELNHLPRLLAVIGLDRPDLVRVQRAKGSQVSPQLLARYAISPRLGKRYPDGSWQLVATPTALVIAMDPENLWATEHKRKRQNRAICDAIREEVEAQSGTITDEQLDFLVNIHVWGDQKYEFANFTDHELVDALAPLASGRDDTDRGSPSWRQRVLADLVTARANHHDIDTIIGRMRVSKPRLADALAPMLLGKLEQEITTGHVITPVLKILLEAERLVQILSGGMYVLTPDA